MQSPKELFPNVDKLADVQRAFRFLEFAAAKGIVLWHRESGLAANAEALLVEWADIDREALLEETAQLEQLMKADRDLANKPKN